MALEPLSRARLIRGGALAIRGLLHEEDLVDISRVGAVPGHCFPQPGSATARSVARSRLFANLALLLAFACLAGLVAHFSGGRSDAPGKLPPGFRSSIGGAERLRNGPVGPEQDVMRLDARSAAAVLVSGLATGAMAQAPAGAPAAAAGAPAAPVEWKKSKGGNDHWYCAARWASPKTWPDARDEAAARGAMLACVTSTSENAWIGSLNLDVSGCAGGTHGWHLGGYQDASAPDFGEPAGGWRWLSGEPWQFTAWLNESNFGEKVPGGDRPNNFGPGGEQYLKMSEPPYQPWWDDVGLGNGNQMCGAILEWSADCNSDGEVDYGQIRRGELADMNGNNIPDCCERGIVCEAAAAGTYPVEWKKSEGGNGHWYRGRPSSTDRSAESWRLEAIAEGAHLVTIVTKEESDWLDVLINQDSLWPSSYVGPIIGLRVGDPGCADGCWVTGETLSWTNWWPGNPDVTNTDRSVCLFDRASRKWQNYPEGGGDFGGLAKPRSTIFEWSADCDADGTVDYGQILRGDSLDRDQNGVLDSCQCGANPSLGICCTSDLDLDGEIGGSDISLLLLTFGEPRWAAPAFDLDGDGEIGGGDISIILLDIGPCP